MYKDKEYTNMKYTSADEESCCCSWSPEPTGQQPLFVVSATIQNLTVLLQKTLTLILQILQLENRARDRPFHSDTCILQNFPKVLLQLPLHTFVERLDGKLRSILEHTLQHLYNKDGIYAAYI